MSERQWYWLGEFANTTIGVGVLLAALWLSGGPNGSHLVEMPTPLRLGLILFFMVLGPTLRTWWHFRR